MQFILDTSDLGLDMSAIEGAIADLDAAALVDIDASSGALRISTSATTGELLACLQQADVHVKPQHLKRRPLECCGGCG